MVKKKKKKAVVKQKDYFSGCFEEAFILDLVILRCRKIANFQLFFFFLVKGFFWDTGL